MLFSTATFAQNIVSVFGIINGTMGTIIDVHLESALWTTPYISDVVQTDINGNFSDTMNFSSSTGWVMVWFEDCNNDYTADSVYFSGNSTLNVSFDYCPIIINYDCNGVANGPDMPGAPCDDFDPNTTNDTWSSNCICTGTQIIFDCLGVPNGPAMPGTPCDDNNPNTLNDTWNNSCGCVGSIPWIDCFGVVNGPDVPGAPCDDNDLYTINDSLNINCDCVGDSTNFPVDCLGIPGGWNLPGFPCDDNDPNTINDAWDVNCICVGDSLNPVIDCLGVVNGPDVPGALCDDNDPNTFFDTWDVNCICVGDSINLPLDCLGIPFGPNMPGTACDDNDPNTFNDLWNNNCVCVGTLSWIDCYGVVNGPDVPGAPCDDNDANTMNDSLDVNCNCVGTIINPCDATFSVVQAYDSINGQIPFEVWAFYFNYNVFFTYTWDFGDGTFSTDPYPTHVYSGNGPYLLCLTIMGNGCTDTYCDTIELDPNGIIVPGQGTGFTLNIFNANALGVEDVELIDDITIVPNPVNGPFELVLESKESVSGTVEIIDLTGRVLSSEELRIQSGANRISMDSAALNAGTYLIRLTYGDKAIVRTLVTQ